MAIDRARDPKQVQTALERAPVVLLPGRAHHRTSGDGCLARQPRPIREFVARFPCVTLEKHRNSL